VRHYALHRVEEWLTHGLTDAPYAALHNATHGVAIGCRMTNNIVKFRLIALASNLNQARLKHYIFKQRLCHNARSNKRHGHAARGHATTCNIALHAILTQLHQVGMRRAGLTAQMVVVAASYITITEANTQRLTRSAAISIKTLNPWHISLMARGLTQALWATTVEVRSKGYHGQRNTHGHTLNEHTHLLGM
jgi:hypothetical protein